VDLAGDFVAEVWGLPRTWKDGRSPHRTPKRQRGRPSEETSQALRQGTSRNFPRSEKALGDTESGKRASAISVLRYFCGMSNRPTGLHDSAPA
jgi:hypothetical protein